VRISADHVRFAGRGQGWPDQGKWKAYRCQHTLLTKPGPSAPACASTPRELGARVTVAIADDGRHLQVLDRMDGAPPLSARIAPAKASSVALFHRDGSELVRLQQAWPALFAQMDHLAGTPIGTLDSR
jgi:hypothetical protein